MEIHEIEAEGMNIGTFASTIRKCARFLNKLEEEIRKEDKGLDDETLQVCAFIALSLIKFSEAENGFRDYLMESLKNFKESRGIAITINKNSSS